MNPNTAFRAKSCKGILCGIVQAYVCQLFPTHGLCQQKISQCKSEAVFFHSQLQQHTGAHRTLHTEKSPVSFAEKFFAVYSDLENELTQA